MIIDAHVHLFEHGKGWSRELAERYLDCGLSRTPLWWEPERTWAAADQHVDLDRLIGHLDAAGVDRAIVFGFVAQPYGCVTDPDDILDAVRRYPDRLVPFHVVDPLGRRGHGLG